MLRGCEVRRARKLVEQLWAICGDKRQRAEPALLQVTMRIERVQQHPLVPVENAGTKGFRAPCLPFQFRELVEYFSLGSVQRANQRAVQTFEPLAVRLHHPLQRLFIRFEAPRQTARKRLLLHFRAQILAAAKVIEGRRISAYPACSPEVELAGASYAAISVDSALTDGKFVTAPAWPAHPAWIAQFLAVLGTRIEHTSLAAV